jgi:beta-carotene ketolase (CrtW type)
VALKIPFRGNPYLLALPVVSVVTFLYTGLFITAHDAMHAGVVPRNRKPNNLIGSFRPIAHALFSFERL